MIRAFDAFSLPLLRWFDPEDAHRLAIQGLKILPPTRPRALCDCAIPRSPGVNLLATDYISFGRAQQGASMQSNERDRLRSIACLCDGAPG